MYAEDEPSAVPAVAGTAGGPHPSSAGSSTPAVADILLETVRRLLRVTSPEQAVGELMRFVHLLGGATAPVFHASEDALPIDLSLGVADPMLPEAPLGSAARGDLVRLLPRLVEDARFAADRARRVGRLSAKVDTDPLTGLGNRRGLRRSRALAETDTVAMLDLDLFKAVNDTFGHDAGDRVLVGFSRMLRRHLRATDQAFRLGGEEFLLVLSATTTSGARVVLENLREAWRLERPLDVTFSGGIAAVETDLVAAVKAADRALYRAKEEGRDRFEVASVHDEPEPQGVQS
jgi:diguanylate cyclase (GGDEF)-like protein